MYSEFAISIFAQISGTPTQWLGISEYRDFRQYLVGMKLFSSIYRCFTTPRIQKFIPNVPRHYMNVCWTVDFKQNLNVMMYFCSKYYHSDKWLDIFSYSDFRQNLNVHDLILVKFPEFQLSNPSVRPLR